MLFVTYDLGIKLSANVWDAWVEARTKGTNKLSSRKFDSQVFSRFADQEPEEAAKTSCKLVRPIHVCVLRKYAQAIGCLLLRVLAAVKK